MAKRRSKGRIAESSAVFKLRKKQRRLRLNAAKARMRIPPKKTKPMTLMEKADQIGLLAIKHGKKSKGAKIFLDFLVMRRSKPIEELKKSSIPHEKKMEVVIRAATPFPNNVDDLNQWLKSIGRADLKLTGEGVIEMILS